MATATILANATRSNTSVTSPAVAQPAGVGQAEFAIVGTGWTTPADVVRLEIWESPDATSPFVFSFGGDFHGGYVPRAGQPASPSMTILARNLLYPRSVPADQLDPGEVLATYPNSRLQGKVIVTGTVTFHLDLTTS